MIKVLFYKPKRITVLRGGRTTQFMNALLKCRSAVIVRDCASCAKKVELDFGKALPANRVRIAGSERERKTQFPRPLRSGKSEESAIMLCYEGRGIAGLDSGTNLALNSHQDTPCALIL
jgi:hypothetical protein